MTGPITRTTGPCSSSGGASPWSVGNGARLGGLLLAASHGVAVADAHDIQPYDTSAKASRGEQAQVIRAYPLLSCSVLETPRGGVVIQITMRSLRSHLKWHGVIWCSLAANAPNRDDVRWACGAFWRHLSAHSSRPELRFCPSFVLGEAPHIGSTLMINHRTKGQTARVHPRDG
jgi:hypothetical protein